MRVGMGYDVHKLVKDRKLIMGGVEIPYELGLLGHSDADVLLHAIMDALLGAAALGDIGKHFPDTDDRYKGISSIKLLEEVGKKIDEKLIIELKDKLDLKEMLEPRSAAAAEIPSDGRNGDIQTEAVQALVALGYGNAESLKAVRQVTEYTSVEDVLKEALKKML